MSFLLGGATVGAGAVPAPPPPPPTPPTGASPAVQASQSAARYAAAAANGQAGFCRTVRNTGGQAGAPKPGTAAKSLMGT